jgi:hypothetical protein
MGFAAPPTRSIRGILLPMRPSRCADEYRCAACDVLDCSRPPTPHLVAGFHSREAPPTPFPTALTARSPPDSVTCFSHSRPWGCRPCSPRDLVDYSAWSVTGGWVSRSRLPGCRRLLTTRGTRPRPAETVRGHPPRVAHPSPPPLLPPEGDRSGSGPLLARPCVVRGRMTEVILRASASLLEQHPKALRSQLVDRPKPSDPTPVLTSRVAPGSRVPTARPRVTASGVPVPPGVGVAVVPPEGGVPSTPLRPRPRRLSTTRPGSTAGLLGPLP